MVENSTDMFHSFNFFSTKLVKSSTVYTAQNNSKQQNSRGGRHVVVYHAVCDVIGTQAARPDDGILDALGELPALPSVAVGREKHR